MDHEQFQQETRQWLEANCPESQRQPAKVEDLVYGGHKCVFPSEDAELWMRRMAEKGWTAPTWPTEYGGGGLDPQLARILKRR